MSHQPGRILFCHCAFAQVVPRAVKEQVLADLCESGVPFDAVPDLCEMAARKDPMLQQLVASGDVRIAACYPRAVRWMLASAGAELSASSSVANMRTDGADAVSAAILGPGFRRKAGATPTPEAPA